MMAMMLMHKTRWILLKDRSGILGFKEESSALKYGRGGMCGIELIAGNRICRATRITLWRAGYITILMTLPRPAALPCIRIESVAQHTQSISFGVSTSRGD